MENRNLYQVLGLDSTASADEIKKAYRFYALKFHPDKHKGDKFFEMKFREVKEAYDILSDPSLRSTYDRQWNTEKEIDLEIKSTPKSNSTVSETSRERPSQTIKVDLVKDQRNKNILIGLGTILSAILIFSIGPDKGWHVPIGMFFIFWTIRQLFVIGTSFFED